MAIKSFKMVKSLITMLMILGVSSRESPSTDCKVHCILPCGKDSSPPLCYIGCMKKCGAASPHPTPVDHCDLGCVTSTCLDPDTDAKKAKACADNCSGVCRKTYDADNCIDDCKESYKPH